MNKKVVQLYGFARQLKFGWLHPLGSFPFEENITQPELSLCPVRSKLRVSNQNMITTNSSVDRRAGLTSRWSRRLRAREHRSSSRKVSPQLRGFESTSLPCEEMCTPAWRFLPVVGNYRKFGIGRSFLDFVPIMAVKRR